MGLGIILADDERSVRESIASLLSGAGYSVRTAKNGEMALALHRSEPCDLFVLDVMMPVMNGFEACTALRASGDGTPVVFRRFERRFESWHVVSVDRAEIAYAELFKNCVAEEKRLYARLHGMDCAVEEPEPDTTRRTTRRLLYPVVPRTGDYAAEQP